MDISDYQSKAAVTDVSKRPLIAILGLAGELGSLLTVYKKRLRDKPSEDQFRAELAEELGDVLWYLSSLATLHKIDMSEVAKANLAKTQAFFGQAVSPIFDASFPKSERFPDHMRVEFKLDDAGRASMVYEGRQLGDTLSDNSHVEDKYRFHDAFHLAFLAHLHWSPVMRRLLKIKRKSTPAVDENEDGARAAIVEEAVAAIIFTHAAETEFYPTVESIPLKLVTVLQKMTSKFEVSECSPASWRLAIYDGCRAFVKLSNNNGGSIEVDISSSTLTVE
ncbi:nucleoside triphosphate pyrophosphohydrolase family protein [Brucella intermedia]|uniref:nucleoside triphosphate pyrophosphohydrolase family protein n=1 Tax=Brucella intermedia TaxID=94625 RepID=UPI0034CE55AC